MIKYIFSISTGRSGSKYLAQLLSEIEGAVSFHEPNPKMNGKPMYEYLKGNSSYLKSNVKEKLKTIKSAKGNSPVYIETNHTFIKGFLL